MSLPKLAYEMIVAFVIATLLFWPASLLGQNLNEGDKDLAFEPVYNTVDVIVLAASDTKENSVPQQSKISRGWAVSAPGQCFIISTAHGVTATDGIGRYLDDLDDINVTGPGRGAFPITRKAKIYERFPSDLAVLTIPDSECPFSDSTVSSAVKGILRRADNGLAIESRQSTGEFEKESLAIYRIRVTPEDAISSPEGWSGASVIRSGKRVGMVFEATDPQSFRFYSIRQIQRELDQLELRAFIPTRERFGYIVDSRGGGGGGAYSSIQSAIDDAPEGSIVTVKPGLYIEQVVVSKNIELIGENIDGRKPTIQWERSTALAVSAERPAVRNFFILGGLIWPNNESGNAALEVTYGSPSFFNVDVRSNSFHCVRFIYTKAAKFSNGGNKSDRHR